MNKITIRKKINPCFFSKDDLIGLAEIAYSLYQKELLSANKEWEERKLPIVVKKIEDHNKALEENKVSYFGSTSMKIEDPGRIIENEKQYFLKTEKDFQQWRSSTFKLVFGDKTIESNEPGIINDVSDTDKIQSVQFDVYSLNGNNRSMISISKNSESFYQIEGEDESWVRATKDKLSEIMAGNEFDRSFLHKDSFKITATLTLTALGVFTYFSLLNKININRWFPESITLWVSILISIIVFIWLVKAFYRTLDSIYPYLQLEIKQKSHIELGIVLIITIGLFTNLIYEVIKWIYKN